VNPSTPVPAISVVTPAFNTAAYLGAAIASVQAQTVGDWEMLIVDDGSTDATRAVAQAAADRDARLRVFATANHGQAAARNLALERARAPLVALLDSDDLWEAEYLAEQMAILEAHPDVSIVSANAVSLGGAYDGQTFWRATSGTERLSAHEIVLHEDAVCVMSMFRRRVVDEIGGFDPRFTGNEDYEFWLRAATAGFPIMRNYRPLGIYRRRSGSTSSDERRMLRGAIKLLRHAAVTYATAGPVQGAIRHQLGVYRRRLAAATIKEQLRRWRLLPLVKSLQPGRGPQEPSRSGAAWQG
jgi:glycosyltransferase involved in cell wall biosynthesis